MAEESKSGGWFKALIGTVTGLAGGAVMMYVTPLVDRVVKPPKPLANFAVETSGLQVTFQNRSAGSEGFWDFGDGSALEPVASTTQTVTHTYPHVGSYTVKLTVRNLFGDENERTVPLEIKGAEGGPPAVVSFEAVPASAQNIAPAMFRLTGKAANAATCVWDCGDDTVAEAVTDPDKRLERTITLAQPGTYKLQLLALRDGQPADRKAVTVQVLPAQSNTLTGVLHVTDRGTRVRMDNTLERIPLQPGAKDQPFDKVLAARPGYVLTEAQLPQPKDVPPGVSKLTAQIAPDHRAVTVHGELAAGPAKGGVPTLFLPLTLRQEKQTPAGRPSQAIAKALQVPGVTLMPLASLPADWVNPQRLIRLEVRDGNQTVWPEGPLPNNATLPWQGRRFTLRAVQVGEQIRVEVTEARPGVNPTAN
jgi:hypothetical protein